MSDSKKTLYSYLIRYKRWAILGGLFMIISVILLTPMPLLTMYIIDDVLPHKNISLLTTISLFFVTALILKEISNNLQGYYFNKFNNKIVFDIQLDIIKKIQKTTSQYRQRVQTGYLISRIKDDTNKLYSLFASTYVSIIKDFITLLVGVIIIFNMHWKLALISISLLPLFIYSLKFFGARIKSISTKLFEMNAQTTKRLHESVSLLDTFVAFNTEKHATIRIIEKQKKHIRTSIKKGILQTIASSSVAIIGGLGPIFVLWYGGIEIINDNLKLGELIAFNSFLGYIFGPTGRVINAFLSMQQAWAAWDRVYDILTKVPDKRDHLVLNNSIKHEECINFENTNLRFNNKQILNNINLTINFKETIAIVGSSGSGKSSLINLLLSLNELESGSIKIYNRNYKDLSVLKQNIALVQQEPVLFSDTIKNNIKLGKFNATDDEVTSAAKLANIDDFINQLPNKYETLIDERGLNMSVGQKQRVAIARCIIRNPEIFIMDEPTSNLDAKSEKELMNSLHNFIESRTTIIVAHRLSSITFADKIIVMNEGSIVESGTHSELLSKEGYYASLWHTQTENSQQKTLVYN